MRFSNILTNLGKFLLFILCEINAIRDSKVTISTKDQTNHYEILVGSSVVVGCLKVH